METLRKNTIKYNDAIFAILEKLDIVVIFVNNKTKTEFSRDPYKSPKVFSYFIRLLRNIFAVNLFLGILARIKYLNFQRRFSLI